MALVNPLTYEATGVWLSRQKFDEAENAYQRYLADGRPASSASPNANTKKHQAGSGLVSQLESMRSKISNVLNTSSPPTRKSPGGDAVADRVQHLEKENAKLCKVTTDLHALVLGLEKRIAALEGGQGGQEKTVTPPKAAMVDEDDDEDDDDDDDDGVDIFGDSSAADQKESEDRLKAQKEKSKKPTPIAKSNLILDVKPWDDETDMKVLEAHVRSVTMDGLLWGASKFVAIGYGIEKLQISCVIEDDKVYTDDIESSLLAFEDIIQSMDIAAFNKV